MTEALYRMARPFNVQRRAAADQLAQCVVQRRQVAADAADVTHHGVAADISGGDVDVVFVNIQTAA